MILEYTESVKKSFFVVVLERVRLVGRLVDKGAESQWCGVKCLAWIQLTTSELVGDCWKQRF